MGPKINLSYTHTHTHTQVIDHSLVGWSAEINLHCHTHAHAGD
jgi:hypothetical protein